MSLTLKDLRVRESDPVFAVTRPASLADLVEVLKDHGAFEIDSRLTKRYWPVIQLEGHTEPGRYLVLPLEDTP